MKYIDPSYMIRGGPANAYDSVFCDALARHAVHAGMAGKTDAVIVWHTDRLHRSPVELEEYVTACEKHGVKTQTVQAGHIDLATASGLMVARMLGATARYEVDHGIERQRRAKQRSAEAGKWKGGRRPYGF